MNNDVLNDIKNEITAIRQVMNSDFEGVGHAVDHIGLDLRLKHLSQTLNKVSDSLFHLKLILSLLVVVVLFK